MRELIGAMLRGEVRKVAAIKSSVASKTLRRPGMSAPPKFGSMKYSCAICQLAHSRGASGQVFAARCPIVPVPRAGLGAGPFAGGPQIKPLRERKAGFIHIRGNVCGIEQKHVPGLRANPAHIPVVQLRLDHVAQLPMPEGELVIALQSGRTDVDRTFNVSAVQRFVADPSEPRRGR